MIRFKLINKKSKIDGKGCFAAEAIPAKHKIGNLGGEIITVREARKRIRQQKKLAMVEFGDGHALDASVHANALRFVNHSCLPNTYMRCCYQQVEFYSLRKIKAGEELTCNYGETHHDGKRPCTCGAPNCKGAI
ncbi:SET domain-containing protein-lysine N-methyltransferase [Flavihumibacter sp. CACIAM 22H1]|uniref:SET domain-containing protein n=1 Tax=Flavihumibacter sp. CACIAM 22H1 TaxID=1812911 RepID=UPI0007A7E079|nr:SET domain-containing protein-lysine N-methyltransferase [Flavihumibacter sp. CACIAM 22H1]KYP13393.1 MAG: SET domain-containing protein-lysine N-methyltransferase [Flavihumibacter sp. CACIAM 22H1]